jgi:ubiquinone/menaquinone biosynthesis C-methylase UbiE
MTIAGTPGNVYGKTYGGSAPEIYERFFVPAIGLPLAHDLMEAADVRDGERVLDVACGTGVVSRLAAARVGRTGIVAAVDVNPAMLQQARFSSEGTEPPIAWYETSAEAMPLPDASFDLVTCQLALMFMTDKPAALQEMRRVLVPGGRAFISVPRPTAFFDVMHDAIERHVGSDAAAFVRLVFSLHDPGAFETLLDRAGFEDVDVRSASKELRLPAAEDFLWQYIQCTPIGASIMTMEESRRAALHRDVVEGWRPWAGEKGLTYHQGVLLGSGRRPIR